MTGQITIQMGFIMPLYAYTHTQTARIRVALLCQYHNRVLACAIEIAPTTITGHSHVIPLSTLIPYPT